jgi:hypothetical protein
VGFEWTNLNIDDTLKHGALLTYGWNDLVREKYVSHFAGKAEHMHFRSHDQVLGQHCIVQEMYDLLHKGLALRYNVMTLHRMHGI